MIRFFKTIQPAALFTVPILVFIFWLPGFFSSAPAATLYDSPLLNWVSALPHAVQLIISILLVAGGALYLNYITNRHEVIYRHSYLPSLFYVVLMSFHRDVILFHPLLVSNLIVLRALDKTFSLFKNDSPVAPIFDASFLLAVASIIYFPDVTLLVLFLYAIYNLRSFSFRELMIALIGFGLPFFFLAVYGFWTDTLSSSANHFFSRFTIHKIEYDHVTGGLLWYAGYFTMLIVLSMVRLRMNFYRNTIKTRSTQEILVLFSIFTAAGLLFLPHIAVYHLTQLAIPFAVFLAYYFISAKKKLWMYEVAFWTLAAFAFAGYF